MKGKFFIITGAICVIIASLLSRHVNSVNTECKKQIDSLQNEIIILQIDNGRYQYILDEVNQRDSALLDSIYKNVE